MLMPRRRLPRRKPRFQQFIRHGLRFVPVRLEEFYILFLARPFIRTHPAGQYFLLHQSVYDPVPDTREQ